VGSWPGRLRAADGDELSISGHRNEAPSCRADTGVPDNPVRLYDGDTRVVFPSPLSASSTLSCQKQPK